ncbi:MAG: hypothetical protein LBS37_01805 [Treponema sp.]|jgi:hypothetical protein|nr:hypothetical protein [Treponema sp.]
MKNKFSVLGMAVLAIGMALCGCSSLSNLLPGGITVKKENAQSPLAAADDSTWAQVDVYVAGYERTDGVPIACYWKNGEKTPLTSGNSDVHVSVIALAGSL